MVTASQCFAPTSHNPFVSALERMFRVKTDRRDRAGGNHSTNQLDQSDIVAVWPLLHKIFVLPEMFDPMLFSVVQHAFPVELPTNKDPEVSGLYKSEAVGCSEDVSVRYEGSPADVLEFPGGLVTNLNLHNPGEGSLRSTGPVPDVERMAGRRVYNVVLISTLGLVVTLH